MQLLVAAVLISMTKSLDGTDSTDNDKAFKLITPSFNVLVANSIFKDLQHAVSVVFFVANILSSDNTVP